MNTVRGVPFDDLLLMDLLWAQKIPLPFVLINRFIPSP